MTAEPKARCVSAISSMIADMRARAISVWLSKNASVLWGVDSCRGINKKMTSPAAPGTDLPHLGTDYLCGVFFRITDHYKAVVALVKPVHRSFDVGQSRNTTPVLVHRLRRMRHNDHNDVVT